MGTTTNFGWEIPDVDADADTWGDIQNTLFQAIDTQLKAVKDTADAAAVATTINALVAAAAPPGLHGYFARSSPPTGWVKANGTTIGNAASGATNRANADTQALFTVFWNDWDNTLLPIQDSAGSVTTRGASAAADFAANKRLPVPELRAEFVRGIDDGRGVDATITLGAAFLDQMQGHRHNTTSAGGGNYTGTGTSGLSNIVGGTAPTFQSGDPITDGTNGTPRVGAETRPRFMGLLSCWKL